MKRITFISLLVLTSIFQAGWSFASDDKHEIGTAEHDRVISPDNEYISTGSALGKYRHILKNTQFHVFPESRMKPIKYYDSLKVSWIEQDFREQAYKLDARPGEYFVFQVGVWALKHDLNDIKIKFVDFESGSGKKLSRQSMTCFNKEGVDFEGNAFVKQVNIKAGRVQTLWIGIDL
ncbi:MAG: hypothetical protein KAI29_22370, partial [Cyclobacteriaceae bacterium]|nr:hypothetical protein [Cyclobacteriaceae bacterium]